MAIASPSAEPRTQAALGPGHRLQEARLKGKLRTEDVAARLRLHVRTIERIEADDYEHLPAPTFVRGYLRGYAKLLNLPPEPIVAAYDSNEFDPPALVPDISNPAQAKSTDFPVRLVTYLIASAIITLVIIWWQNQAFSPLSPQGWSFGDNRTAGSRLDNAGAQDATTGAVPTVTDAESRSGSLTDGAAAPARGPVPGSLVASDRNPPAVVLATGARTDAPPTGPAPSPSPPAPGAGLAISTLDPPRAALGAGAPGAASEPRVSAPGSGAPKPLVPKPAAPRTDAVATAPPGDTAAPNRAHLRIVLRHESWVEVYNHDDSRLYYDLARAGEIIDVEGAAPFKVLLGYADQAEVQFNGEPYDYSPHLDRGMARFTLGPTVRTQSIGPATAYGPAPAVAESQVLPHPSQQR